MQDATLFGILAVVAGGLVAAGFVWRRRRRERHGAKALHQAVSLNLHVPPSLHPLIDPDRCIGSLSCIQACPEGDILGVVEGRGALISGANCIGHGRCASECPLDAIRLVFGTSERGVDLPEVDQFFESSRPGVHIVGELGGMGLIRNAVTQGVEVVEHLHAVLPPSGGEAADVAIVGAGPAGLACALGLRAKGRSFRIIDQGRFGGTMANYPRHKVVMTERLQLPLYGKLGGRLIEKEELLAAWEKAAHKGSIEVEQGVKLDGLDGEDGRFALLTSAGAISARKVVLATGRRGTPRKLGVPGEELSKVTYCLMEPEQYNDSKVLVVGGGDSALEAALQLCAETNAEVTLSYRGEALGKCREANRQKFQEQVRARRLKALLPSQVTAIQKSAVELQSSGRPIRIANDYVIVQIGGELPVEMLQKMGISMRRHHGADPHARLPSPPARTRTPKIPTAEERQRRQDQRLAIALFALGALIVAGLIVAGWDYYLLPALARRKSVLHAALRPAGVWGHGVGVVATAFMLSNFLYSARKRLKSLKGGAPIRRWLLFHMFVGFMSPLVIAFHAAFRSNNLLATATAGSLCVVVLTGILGRYVYGLVSTRDGRTEELAQVAARWHRLLGEMGPAVDHVKDPVRVRALMATATAEPPKGSLIAMLFVLPFWSVRDRIRLLGVRRLFREREGYEEFAASFRKLASMRVQLGFLRSLKRLMSGWRAFHVVLALVLVLMIAAHIGVSLFLGYGWILF